MEPVSAVSMLSTGTVDIHPEQVGPTWKSPYHWLFTSRRWTGPRPINVYVIEHATGLVLFDCGQDRASVTDPRYFPGGLAGQVYKYLAKFDIGPGDTLTAQLTALGYDIRDVRTVVISHLHQDHIGGLPELPHAEIIISREEWSDAMRGRAEMRGFLRSHIDLPGLQWRQIVPEPVGSDLAPFALGHDLFDDGSLVLLPTPGHTAGSTSMLVRRSGHPPLLMVGDVTYDDDRLKAGLIPGLGKKRQVRETSERVNELRGRLPGLVVLPTHDPGAAGRFSRALDAGDDMGAGTELAG